MISNVTTLTGEKQAKHYLLNIFLLISAYFPEIAEINVKLS